MNDNNSVLDLGKLEQHERELSAKAAAVKEKKTIPKYIYNNLPTLLKNGVGTMVELKEKELFLVGALGVISGCLPNVQGFYGGKYVYPNLFVYALGKYGTGKSALLHARQLGMGIHNDKRERYKRERASYKEDLKAFRTEQRKNKGSEGEPPELPPNEMLFIPANNSKSGLMKLITDNDGKCILFETEGDTLADALKTDHGGYSDILRKGASHEPITSYRKTDDEFMEVVQPKISCVLSSTSDQMKRLIPTIENGLFSRFIFYRITPTKGFNDVFDKRKRDYTNRFADLATEFKILYEQLSQLPEPIEVELTDQQKEAFLKHFSEMKSELTEFVSDDLQGTVNRLGLTCFRIIMILTIIRNNEGGFEPKQTLICDDKDFQTAIKLSTIFCKSALNVFYEMPDFKKNEKKKNSKTDIDRLKLIKQAKALHDQGASFREISIKLKIAKGTAHNYVNTDEIE